MRGQRRAIPVDSSAASEFLPLGNLARQQERFGVFSVATDLERAEVLVPCSIRGVRIRLPPQLKLIEVFCGDLALAEAFEKMIAERRW